MYQRMICTCIRIWIGVIGPANLILGPSNHKLSPGNLMQGPGNIMP